MVEDLLAASHTKTRQTCECEMSKKEDAIKKELLRLLFSPYIIAVINSFMIRVSLATPTLCQNFFQGPSSALLAVVFVYSSD